MDKPTLTPTDEQLHILHLLSSCKDNLLINALAGSGKTSSRVSMRCVLLGAGFSDSSTHCIRLFPKASNFRSWGSKLLTNNTT